MTNSIKILLAIFFLSSSFSQAQGEAREKQIYVKFDNIIGQENTGLLNGVEYIERNRTINEFDKYFLSSRFQPGSLIYDGQPYFEVQMKYNIWDDLILVKIPFNRGTPVLELHKSKISAFKINGHKFTNIEDQETGMDISGFHEILLENHLFQLLKKHKLKEKTILDKDYSYYEYRSNDPDYILFYQGNYSEINSKRELSEQFPELKREITKFYRSQRSLRKLDKDQFMRNMMREISSLKEPQV